MFLGQNIPACGFSLGLERILVVMAERKMFPPTLATTPADVMIATFDAAGGRGRDAAGCDAARRRACACSSTRTPRRSASRSSTLIRRGIPFVALLGDDEIKAGTVTVKNLAAQTQATLRPVRGRRRDTRGIEATWLSNSVI